MSRRRCSIHVLLWLVVLGLMVHPVLGGASSKVTRIKGTIVSPFDNGVVHGFGFKPAEGGVEKAPLIATVLYDNLLPTFGGSATPGMFGPGPTTGVFAYVDWTATTAQWTDDLHGLPPGAVVTQIKYGYANLAASATHIIQIYDMSPLHPTFTTTVSPGSLLASIVLTGRATGMNFVTVTGLSVPLAGPDAWISFKEQGAGFPGTFWLTGGNPGVGSSHPGLGYLTPGYNLWVPLSYLYFSGTGYVAANIEVALLGTFCGNSITDGAEECDDGNNVDGDGCNANCVAEFCGDGITQPGLGESCDDGNNVDNDGCSAGCRLESCGDGVTQTSEECDDGNLVDGDGCDSNCTHTRCGNGIVTDPELCDDGNLVDGDGCNSKCVPDGACCTGGGTPGTPVECLVTTEERCGELNGFYRGDRTGCGVGAEAVCYALEVTMASMSALETSEGVLIRWTTASEIDTVSFRLLRETLSGAAEQKRLDVVGPLIPAAGHGLVGASYEFLDNSKPAAAADQYWIEDVDLFGRVTRHGPIPVERRGFAAKGDRKPARD